MYRTTFGVTGKKDLPHSLGMSTRQPRKRKRHKEYRQRMNKAFIQSSKTMICQEVFVPLCSYPEGYLGFAEAPAITLHVLATQIGSIAIIAIHKVVYTRQKRP
jgi:hypothetical protein